LLLRLFRLLLRLFRLLLRWLGLLLFAGVPRLVCEAWAGGQRRSGKNRRDQESLFDRHAAVSLL
jgi:hypothetical protein